MENEKQPLNGKEMFQLEMMYALLCKTDELDVMEPRMRKLKLWQYYKPAIGMLRKVVHGIFNDLPMRNLRHMEDVSKHYYVEIRPKPVVGTPPCHHVISHEDMQMICEAAAQTKCSICMADTKEAKKCQLRDFFLQVAPPDEIRESGLCDYATMITKPEDEP